MLLEILKNEKVALDGINVVAYKKGDIIELDQKSADKMIGYKVAQEVKEEVKAKQTVKPNIGLLDSIISNFNNFRNIEKKLDLAIQNGDVKFIDNLYKTFGGEK